MSTTGLIRMLRVAWIVCVLIALFADRIAGAKEVSDWPNLRGPHWNGHSDAEGLADSWGPEGPPVLWEKEIGRGYSSVIAGGDAIFTQTQTLYGQYVVCLAADTGEERWRYRYDWPYEGGNVYPGPRATPSYYEGRIYFASPSGLIGCLDAKTGQSAWSRNVTTEYAGRGASFGYSSSPLVVEGRVIVPVGGEGAGVVALDAATGQTIWTSGGSPISYCPVMPIQIGGKPFLVLHLQNSWAVLERESGRLVYEQRFSKGYDEHAALPLYEEPWLVLASPFRGGAQAFRLSLKETSGELERPESSWFSEKFSNDVCSSVVHRGRIFGFDLMDIQSKAERPSRGELRCLDVASGKILWSTNEVGQCSLIVADNKLLLFTDSGELVLARRSDEAYRELARTKVFLGEICWTSPALRGDRLYLRSPTRLACLYLGPPQALSSELASVAHPAAANAAAPPVDWLKILVGSEREFPFDPPDREELLRWYVASIVLVFLPAILLSGVLGGLQIGLGQVPGEAWRRATIAVYSLLAVLGIVATPMANRFYTAFIFTWPVTLWVLLQTAVLATTWAERQADRRRARYWSRGAGLGLLVGAAAYFHACRRCNMSMEWIFLAGFLFAWPVALVKARLAITDRWTGMRGWLLAWIGDWAGYSVLFWGCGTYYLWRWHELGAGPVG